MEFRALADIEASENCIGCEHAKVATRSEDAFVARNHDPSGARFVFLVGQNAIRGYRFASLFGRYRSKSRAPRKHQHSHGEPNLHGLTFRCWAAPDEALSVRKITAAPTTRQMPLKHP